MPSSLPLLTASSRSVYMSPSAGSSKQCRKAHTESTLARMKGAPGWAECSNRLMNKPKKSGPKPSVCAKANNDK